MDSEQKCFRMERFRYRVQPPLCFRWGLFFLWQGYILYIWSLVGCQGVAIPCLCGLDFIMPEKKLMQNNQKKNIKISFRTEENTLKSIKDVSSAEQKSVSQFIEESLEEYISLCDMHMCFFDDTRKFLRKRCSIPIMMSVSGYVGLLFLHGEMVSISLHAIQILLNEDFSQLFFEQSVNVLFSLPTSSLPLLLQCRVRKIDNSCSPLTVIAELEHCTLEQRKSIEKYLTSKEFVTKQR